MYLLTELKLVILKFIIEKPLKLRHFFELNKDKLKTIKRRLPGPHNDPNYKPEPVCDHGITTYYNRDGYPIYDNGEINWHKVCKNPSNIDFIKEHLPYVDWSALSSNPTAIDILEQNFDKIDWLYICLNDNAYHLISENLDKVELEGNDAYRFLSLNHNPKVLDLLVEHYPNKIMWWYLESNPGIYEVDETLFHKTLNNLL